MPFNIFIAFDNSLVCFNITIETVQDFNLFREKFVNKSRQFKKIK